MDKVRKDEGGSGIIILGVRFIGKARNWRGQGHHDCGAEARFGRVGVFAIGANAKRMTSRALGDIFSGGRASNMEIPVQYFKRSGRDRRGTQRSA